MIPEDTWDWLWSLFSNAKPYAYGVVPPLAAVLAVYVRTRSAERRDKTAADLRIRERLDDEQTKERLYLRGALADERELIVELVAERDRAREALRKAVDFCRLVARIYYDNLSALARELALSGRAFPALREPPPVPSEEQFLERASKSGEGNQAIHS